MRHIIGILVIGSLLSSCDYREAVTGNRRGMDYITRDDYRKAFKAYWRKVKSGALPRPALPETTAQPGVVDEEEQTEQDLLDEAFGIEN